MGKTFKRLITIELIYLATGFHKTPRRAEVLVRSNSLVGGSREIGAPLQLRWCLVSSSLLCPPFHDGSGADRWWWLALDLTGTSHNFCIQKPLWLSATPLSLKLGLCYPEVACLPARYNFSTQGCHSRENPAIRLAVLTVERSRNQEVPEMPMMYSKGMSQGVPRSTLTVLCDTRNPLCRSG